jgi:hypothetical protein
VEGTKEAFGKLAANGGGAVEFDTEARAAVAAANDKIVKDLASQGRPGVDVDQFQERADHWQGLLADPGYEDTDVVSFAESFSNGAKDPSAFVEALFEQVLLEHRPE